MRHSQVRTFTSFVFALLIATVSLRVGNAQPCEADSLALEVCDALSEHCNLTTTEGDVARTYCQTTCNSCTLETDAPRNNETLVYKVGFAAPCFFNLTEIGIHFYEGLSFWQHFTGASSSGLSVGSGFVRVELVPLEVCPTTQNYDLCSLWVATLQELLTIHQIDAIIHFVICRPIQDTILQMYSDNQLFQLEVFDQYDSNLTKNAGPHQWSMSTTSFPFEVVAIQALIYQLPKFGVAGINSPYFAEEAENVAAKFGDNPNVDMVYYQTYENPFMFYDNGTFAWDILDKTLLEMRDADVQVAMFVAGEEHLHILRRIVELQINFPVLSFLYLLPENILHHFGAASNFVLSSVYYLSSMDMPCSVFGSNAVYAQTFLDVMGKAPSEMNARGSSLGVLLQHALQKGGSLNVQRMSDAMEKMHEPSIWRTMEFTQNHRIIGDEYLVIQIQDERVRILDPSSLADSAFAMPAPSWECRHALGGGDSNTPASEGCDDLALGVWRECLESYPTAFLGFNSTPCQLREEAMPTAAPTPAAAALLEADDEFPLAVVLGLAVVLSVIFLTFMIICLLLLRRQNQHGFWVSKEEIEPLRGMNGELVVLEEGMFGPVYLSVFRGTKVIVKPLSHASFNKSATESTPVEQFSALGDQPQLSRKAMLTKPSFNGIKAEHPSPVSLLTKPSFNTLLASDLGSLSRTCPNTPLGRSQSGHVALKIGPGPSSTHNTPPLMRAKSGSTLQFLNSQGSDSLGQGFRSRISEDFPFKIHPARDEETHMSPHKQAAGPSRLKYGEYHRDSLESWRDSYRDSYGDSRVSRFSERSTVSRIYSAGVLGNKWSTRWAKMLCSIFCRRMRRFGNVCRTLLVSELHKRMENSKEALRKEVSACLKFRHPNIVSVLAAFDDEETDQIGLVLEFLEYGSLDDLLYTSMAPFDLLSVARIIADIAAGLQYLHESQPQVVHGDVRSTSVMLGQNLTAKVTNFGFKNVRHQQHEERTSLFWKAPELLAERSGGICTTCCTPASDIYALGITIWQLVSRQHPDDIVKSHSSFRRNMRKGRRFPIPNDTPPELVHLIETCWQEDPKDRPDISEVRWRAEELVLMYEKMENDAVAVQHQTTLSRNQLLNQILPPKAAEALAQGKKVEPEQFDPVTIFFSDIVEFTVLSSTLPPQKVMAMLDSLFTQFDDKCRECGLFKVETIGDAYMCVGGLPEPQHLHCLRVALFGLETVKIANNTLIDEDKPQLGHVNIRAGFHSGPVVASVVGELNPRYCLFGDTVNQASRMESNSEANCINMSPDAHKMLVEQAPEVKTISRGMVLIKGKGNIECFFLDRSEENYTAVLARVSDELED